MRWGKYERGTPDPGLDPLRNRVGELHESGQSEGLIATWIVPVWNQSSGALWWKKWTEPAECLTFEISWIVGGREYLYDDAVVKSDDVIVRELLTGTLMLYGDPYEVKWLSGDDALAAMEVMGVAKHWAQKASEAQNGQNETRH